MPVLRAVTEVGRLPRLSVASVRAAAAALLCCLPVACGSNAPLDCGEFNLTRADWGEFEGAADLDSPTPRQRLAEAVIECETLDGVRRRQVHALLGDPDAQVDRGREERWLTGPTAYGVDYEELTVRFDAESRVVSIAVIQG